MEHRNDTQAPSSARKSALCRTRASGIRQNTPRRHPAWFKRMHAARPDPQSTITAARPRALLVIGTALLLAAPLVLLRPAAHWAGDPELFRLLRGMAGIKAVLAVLAFAVVWWRLGRPGVTFRPAATYVGGVWAMALATGLIWQLTTIPAASLLFHAAIVTLLVTAWRDVEPGSARRSSGQLGKNHRQRPAERHRAGQRADDGIAAVAIHPAADQAVDQEVRDDHHRDDQQEEQVLERQRHG
jgi:hypothetical protein